MLSLLDLLRRIVSGELTPAASIRAAHDAIVAGDAGIEAFVHVDGAARASTDGPLRGIAVGVKDIIDTADFPTECGSAYLSGRRTRNDATVVSRLRAAGAVIIGKTVTTEFAYFHPGKTRNPRDLERTPGGSSSGSAAAVAAGQVPVAVGTQTNGSIIRPASFCGVFAMKPSHGLVSRTGVLPLSRTLDHVGPFARSIEDLALMLDAMAGYDAEDPDTRPLAARNFRAVANEDFGLPPRLAFVKTPVWEKADADTREAFEELALELGEACFTHDLPERYADAWPAQRAIMAVEMAHNLGKFADEGNVSRQFADLVAEGRAVKATEYLAALRDARRFAEELMEIYEQYADAIITPSARGIAPLGIEATGDPAFCSLWSLTGLPSLNLPILANADGLPIGVQLVGAPKRDEKLLQTARALIDSLGET
jgi:Asp-tRNA(Asn)/Glu-tRNA(Gln) amidotransferase A subunit family amidase